MNKKWNTYHLRKNYPSKKIFSYNFTEIVKSDRYVQTDGMRETETENYIDIFREIKGENEEESERQTTKSWNKSKGE